MVRLGQNPFVRRHHRADLPCVTVTALHLGQSGRPTTWNLSSVHQQPRPVSQRSLGDPIFVIFLRAGAEQRLYAALPPSYQAARSATFAFRESLRTKLLNPGGCRALPGSLTNAPVRTLENVHMCSGRASCALRRERNQCRRRGTHMCHCAPSHCRSCFNVCTHTGAKSHMSY
jgi:hypothetical protein